MPSLAVVPAAGAAERFGADKLLANVGGTPLLERAVRSLLEGGVGRVVVVLGLRESEVRARVPVLGERAVAVATNRDPARGMLSSIQEGLRAARGGDPILVLPGDMPYVEPATVAAILARQAETGGIVSPRYGGKRGHPVALPGSLRDEVLAAGPDSTLHDVLRAHASRRLDLDVYDRGVVRDVDVPEDLTERAP